MCLIDFYTSIYNIGVGFIKIRKQNKKIRGKNQVCQEDGFIEVKWFT